MEKQLTRKQAYVTTRNICLQNLIENGSIIFALLIHYYHPDRQTNNKETQPNFYNILNERIDLYLTISSLCGKNASTLEHFL